MVRDAELRPVGPSDYGPVTLADQFRHIRQYWWLVAAVVVLAVSGGFVSTINTPTTYTGRSSLIVSSNNRSPDQDAVLVQGYVDYFDDSAYQAKLLANAQQDRSVTVSARAAAASPILVIEATAPTARAAKTAAAAVAKVFQYDINQVHERANERELSTLKARLTRLQALSASGPTVDTQMTEIQTRILQIQGDQVNLLQELQFNGGVAENAPARRNNLLFSLVAGLLIGVLSALGIGRLSGASDTTSSPQTASSAGDLPTERPRLREPR